MVDVVQTGPVDIRTTLASVEPTQVSTGTTGAAIAALGDLATKGYAQYAKGKAQADAREVLTTLDSDIEEWKRTGELESVLNANIDEMAKQHPALKEYFNSMKSLSLAEKQGKAIPVMLNLRAEAALKRAISRAPGLRSEIASITKETLGFDPTGATIEVLMEKFGTETSSTGPSYEDKQVLDEAYKRDVVPVYNSDGSVNYTATRKYVNTKISYDAEVKEIERKRKAGLITEADSIQAMDRQFRNLSNARLANMRAAILNVSAGIRTQEELNTVMTQLAPYIETYKQESMAFASSTYDQFPVTGENAGALRTAKENFIKDNNAILDGLTASLTVGEFNQRLEASKYLMENLQMEWTEANQTMALIAKVSPGLIPQVSSMIIAQNPDTQRRVSQMIAQGISTASPEMLARADLSKLISVMADRTAFDKIPDDDKPALQESYFKKMKEMVSKGETSKLSDQDITQFSNLFVASLQLSEAGYDKNAGEISAVTSTAEFSDMVNRLSKMGGDNAVKAEILADSAIKANTSYMREKGVDAISRLASSPFVGGSTLSFNAETGTLSVSFGGRPAVGRPEENTRARDSLKRAVSNYNKSIKAVSNLSSHDPSIDNYNEGQVAALFAVEPLRSIGAEIVGKVPEVSRMTTEQRREVDFDKLVNDLKMQLIEGRTEMQDPQTRLSIARDILKQSGVM